MSSYNIDIQYPGIQGAAGSATAGGANTDIQYNGSGTLVGTGNFTTDGLGNVSISGQGYGDGLLTITTAGSDALQQPALILRDESNGDDGVSQYFQWGSSGTYDYQVSINYNGSIFSFIDDYASRTFFEYNSFISITLGDGNIPITLSSKYILQPVFVVSQLSPTGNTGARSFVNNSTVDATGNFGAIVVGGGAYTVPVWCDGTNWRIG